MLKSLFGYKTNKCVEPHASVRNMTLPAAAAQAPADIDRYLAATAPGLRQAAAALWVERLLLSTGQMVGRTPDRYIDPAPHTKRAASKMIASFLCNFQTKA